MAFPTSDKRLTRSQARAGTPAVATKTPMGTSTPSSASQNAKAFSKAGRRVLAELACNDSPIVGLLPAGTPTSHKSKCSDGGPSRSRRALLADPLPSCPASTPLGESLLRSQVQMLLQKVGSDIYSKQQEKSASLHMGDYVMGASPIMLAAPTPLNTPASTMSLHQRKSQVRDSQLSSQGHATDAFGQVAEVSTFLGMLARHPESNDEILGAALTETHLQSVSTALSTDDHPPLLLEVSDTPSSSEIFMGKRVLNFDDDTPCTVTQENASSRVCFAEETGEGTPALRQPDDDEVSEWSVSVNVGSPADKQCLVEVCEGIATSSSSSSVEEHVENMQHVSTHTVHLVWDEEMQKKAPQDERAVEGLCEEDDERYTEDSYGEDENEEEYGDKYEASEECEDLCDMFRDMGFGEFSRGLPKGEGKHIRFLYEDGDDEIVEAMVVGGEEDVSHSSGAVRLKGLPAPSGRHWRFEQDEEGKG
ncbi:hypothetical protein L7F22_050942 [Adiantum nelumboides]|nr:hypothetical protein [Adiantum nelumboides]